MRKNKYSKPEIIIIEMKSNIFMDTWSLGVDNDPEHGIKPGDEGDIGAKQNTFDGFLDDTNYSPWDN